MNHVRQITSEKIPICNTCIKAVEADLAKWLKFITFKVENFVQATGATSVCVRCERIMDDTV